MIKDIELDKIYLSLDEAVALLPEGECVHTFRNPNGMLLGFDIDRESIIKQLTDANFIEVTGESAQRLGHGIAIKDKLGWMFIQAKNFEENEASKTVAS